MNSFIGRARGYHAVATSLAYDKSLVEALQAAARRRRWTAAWQTFKSDVRRGAGYSTGAALVFIALKVIQVFLVTIF